MLFQQKKALSYGLFWACAIFLIAASAGYAETVPADASKMLPVLRAMGSVVNHVETGAPEVPAASSSRWMTPVERPVVSKQEIIVVEAPKRLSLDRLRRESSRYPEQDLIGRFVECATECPPLFGTDD